MNRNARSILSTLSALLGASLVLPACASSRAVAETSSPPTREAEAKCLHSEGCCGGPAEGDASCGGSEASVQLASCLASPTSAPTSSTAALRTDRWWLATISLVVSLAGCGEQAGNDPPRTPELAIAIDLDPNPDVVEIDLVAEPATVEFLSGVPTEVLGYRDGATPGASVSVPGPLIRAEVGNRLIVHFHNRTDRPTTVHWHGLRLPAAMDGNPMVAGAVPPGADFDYDFVLLDAGTFWYHPHVQSDEQVELGLHGALLVEDPSDPPSTADRLFVLDDIDLAADGSIALEPSEEDRLYGRSGELVLVNGKPPATLVVPAGGRERWRFINAANGRHFRLSLGGRPFAVIAWDGGRIETPYAVDELLVAPGERYELSIDFDGQPGERWQLETLEVDRGDSHVDMGPRELIEVVLGEADGQAKGPPAAAFAREVEMLPIDAATLARPFVLEQTVDPVVGPVFTINGQRWPLNTPVEVGLGAVEVWEVENEGMHPHPFHVHGLFFEVLDIDGAPPPARGRKDTVAIPGRSTARLALRYGEPGMWMFHCSIFEHAEGGMMGDLMIEP
jgi:FtsP/CotA-like multicopper oxidase with cupredoxin domain